MKKVLSVLVFSFLFIGVHHTYATSLVCSVGDHAVWNETNTERNKCISDVDWQIAITTAYNSTNQNDYISVPSGRSLMTVYGQELCSWWFPSGCVIKKSLFLRFL